MLKAVIKILTSQRLFTGSDNGSKIKACPYFKGQSCKPLVTCKIVLQFTVDFVFACVQAGDMFHGGVCLFVQRGSWTKMDKNFINIYRVNLPKTSSSPWLLLFIRSELLLNPPFQDVLQHRLLCFTITDIIFAVCCFDSLCSLPTRYPSDITVYIHH